MDNCVLILKISFIIIAILLGLYVLLNICRVFFEDTIDFKKYRIIQITKSGSTWYEVQRWWFEWYTIVKYDDLYPREMKYNTLEEAKYQLEQRISEVKQKKNNNSRVKVVYKIYK